MKIKFTLMTIGLWIVIILVIYLVFAFIAFDLNIGNWHWFLRLICGLGMFSASVELKDEVESAISLMRIHEEEKKKNNDKSN